MQQKVQERSKGPHDPYMMTQRNPIQQEVAANQLFDKEANNGITGSFEESRIGLKALRSGLNELKNYVEGMEAYYKDNPNEPDWKHHEAPKGLVCGPEGVWIHHGTTFFIGAGKERSVKHHLECWRFR